MLRRLIYCLFRKKVKEMVKQAYEEGIDRGFKYFLRMNQVEERKRGMILGGTNVDREVEKILAEKGF